MEDVAKEVTLEEFVPRYTNQAIIFTGDDMGGDRSMMIVLLYIIIRDHGICLCNHYQQHNPKRGKCNRHLAGIWLYKR